MRKIPIKNFRNIKTIQERFVLEHVIIFRALSILRQCQCLCQISDNDRD